MALMNGPVDSLGEAIENPIDAVYNLSKRHVCQFSCGINSVYFVCVQPKKLGFHLNKN